MSKKTIFYRSFQVTVTLLLLMLLMACSYYPAIKSLNNEPQQSQTELENEEEPLIEHTENPLLDPELELSVDFEAEPIVTDVDFDPLEQEKEKEEEQEQEIKDEKRIALTFDDGPDLKYTPQILEILQEKGVRATFFVVGIQVNKFPEVLQQIVSEEHLIGNHSYSHRNFTKLTPEEILEEIEMTDTLIEAAIGYYPNIVRVPYGATNDAVKEQLAEIGRDHILWNIDPRDWAGTSVEEMYENVMSNARDGGNILFHSFGGKQIENTVELLPQIIDELIAEGYTFVTVDQLY